jgi:hypothetical protein
MAELHQMFCAVSNNTKRRVIASSRLDKNTLGDSPTEDGFVAEARVTPEANDEFSGYLPARPYYRDEADLADPAFRLAPTGGHCLHRTQARCENTRELPKPKS